MINNNFAEVKPLCYLVQHVLPLVYDDSLSYMELLGRVTKKLNELIVNNNKLPDFIAELIKDYISSGAIEKVLAEVLADYMLNVKFPPAGLKPATGDGSADDTEAIQGCIDYAYNNGGMSVYFPSGSYLTQPLTLRNKATLFGQDRYTTRLVMKGGATTAMFTGDVDELTLTGLGFDGNMDIQVNNVNLFTISVNSAIITNCLLTDGYELLNITVNDDLQLNNVIFKHAIENALVLKGEGIVQGNNLIFKSVSALVGKNFVVMDVSKSILEQLKCYGASPNAVLINGSNNVVKMWNEQSLKAYTDNGNNNTVEVYTQSEQKKLTGFKTTNVSGDLTETVGGNRTENITNEKHVIAGSITEDITGDKHVNAANIIETVQGDKTVTAGDISETAVNKTVHITKDSTEQTDGTRTLIVTGANNETTGARTLIVTGANNETTGARTETVNGNKTEHVTGISNEIVDGNKTTNVNGTNEFTGNKVKFSTTKPLGYVAPTSGNNYNTIPFTDTNNNEYKAVIENEKFSRLIDSMNSMPYINVTLHGVKNDGTDTTEDIKNVISQFPQHVLFFPDGVYGISEPIKIDNDINKRVCLKLSEMATIKALDNFSGNFLVDLYYKGTDSGINIGKSDFESFGITGGFYNCNNKCSGIHIGKTHDTYIMNVNIYQCTDYGIKIDDPFDYPSADAWLFDIIIRGYADKTIGLYINSGDNNICRLRTWDTNIGIWANRGYNTFNHIHVLCSAYENLTQEQYEKTVGIVLNGGDCYNNVFTDCYTDNFNTGIHCVSCGNNIFTRLFALCNDNTFTTKKIGILVDDFYRLTINSFTFYAQQSGAVSVSVPNYSWFNTGDLTSFGYIDHRFFAEGDTAKLDIFNDASMFSPFNRIYDYNIGTSGQVANTYRLIGVVRASNIPYSFKINGYSISCDINIMLDISNTFNLNSIRTYLDRNPTSKIAIGLIGEHFGRNLYGIYIVSSGSAYYNVKFDYLAADQMVLIPPRAIANYNDYFKDKPSISELYSHDLVNYPNES